MKSGKLTGDKNSNLQFTIHIISFGYLVLHHTFVVILSSRKVSTPYYSILTMQTRQQGRHQLVYDYNVASADAKNLHKLNCSTDALGTAPSFTPPI
jgi:hypothetical protein